MKTLFIGRNIIRLTEVGSTNSYANTMLKSLKIPEGTIVWADYQSEGRGQRGSVWIAEPAANITCSLIITPLFLNAENHFLISKIIALAIKRALADILTSSNYDIKIKWPNDILVNNKKIAGILIENSIKNSQIINSIIGFGINVNQTNFAELSKKACSLKTLINNEFDKQLLFNKVCEHFEALYLQLKSSKYKEINEAYLHDLLFYNKAVIYTEVANSQAFEGKITEVTEDGKISILLITGEIKKYEMKEISFEY